MKQEKNEGFWNRFDYLRGNKSVRQFAVESGLRDNTLNVMRAEKSLPSSMNLYKMAKGLNCTMEWLLTGENHQDMFVPTLNKIYMSEELMQIAEALIVATPEQISAVKLILRVEEKKQSKEECV